MENKLLKMYKKPDIRIISMKFDDIIKTSLCIINSCNPDDCPDNTVPCFID